MFADPVTNRILTTLIQLALLSIDIWGFWVIYQSEKHDPFITADIQKRKAQRRAIKTQAHRESLPQPKKHIYNPYNLPLIQYRRHY